MHTRNDLSCARGYEFWLIAEAKKRNPSILTYGLSWAVPQWVGDGQGNGTGFHSPDNWLYQTQWVACVRNATGATLDYLGTWNEKPPGDPSYVKGLRAALDAAGFSSTRISVYDGDFSVSNVIAAAQADPDFAASFTSIGRHYPCNYPRPDVESAIHKAYWSSEDYSQANDWAGASCWGRLLNQNYVRMNMTATIAWSLIWSPPATLPFSGAGLMSAQQPWSGHYSGGDGAGGANATPSLNGPLWTSAHTTQFTRPGWRYLPVSSGGSGFLPPSAGNGSYVTLVPPNGTGDFTLVIEKAAASNCHCSIPGVELVGDGFMRFVTSGGLPGAGTVLEVWRSNETVQFWRDEDVTIGSDGSFLILVPRDTFVTLTTLRGSAAHGGVPPDQIPPPAPFPLPYRDDFDSYPEDTTPVKFWADQTGSFAVREACLQQVVTLDPGSNRWAAEDLDPITLLGDGTLGNVTLSVGFTFSPAAQPSGQCGFNCTYVQACARVTAYTGFKQQLPPGVCLAVNASGAWVARAGGVVLGEGSAVPGIPTPFDPIQVHAFVLSLQGTRALGWVLQGEWEQPQPDGGGLPPLPTATPVLNTTITAAYSSGLVGLGSGYHPAQFYNVFLLPSV